MTTPPVDDVDDELQDEEPLTFQADYRPAGLSMTTSLPAPTTDHEKGTSA